MEIRKECTECWGTSQETERNDKTAELNQNLGFDSNTADNMDQGVYVCIREYLGILSDTNAVVGFVPRNHICSSSSLWQIDFFL